MSDDKRVVEIKAWFTERGYEFVVHPVEHGGYFAPYMRIGKQGGNAPFTWGQTPVEAAEAAQAEFEQQEERDAHERNEAAARDALRSAGNIITGSAEEPDRSR